VIQQVRVQEPSGLTHYPFAEKVPGGYRSGTYFWRDDEVTDVIPIAQGRQRVLDFHPITEPPPDPISKVLHFAAGVAHERGHNIATNTRRSPVARERAVLAEGMRLLAVGPFGARQAAWLLAGYVEGAESVVQGVAS